MFSPLSLSSASLVLFQEPLNYCEDDDDCAIASSNQRNFPGDEMLFSCYVLERSLRTSLLLPAVVFGIAFSAKGLSILTFAPDLHRFDCDTSP